MNIPDLFALTTQTKPSSLLSQAIPQAQDDPVGEISLTANKAEITTDDTASETDTTTDVVATADASEQQSAQAEEFTTFLTLLTAQIRNQDPLAPLDSTQFVDQLATFSNLELQAEGNQTLEEIARILANQSYASIQGET